MMMMMAHVNPIPRRSQVKCDGCNDKKDDNDHDDDEKDEENVVSYEISSETLTRRGWSQQAKLEQEGRKKSTLSTILCRARLLHLMCFQRYLCCFQHLFCFHSHAWSRQVKLEQDG